MPPASSSPTARDGGWRWTNVLAAPMLDAAGRITYELSGRGKVWIEEGGAQYHLEFPLTAGASILETCRSRPRCSEGQSI